MSEQEQTCPNCGKQIEEPKVHQRPNQGTRQLSCPHCHHILAADSMNPVNLREGAQDVREFRD